MQNWQNNIIPQDYSLLEALDKLNSSDVTMMILFVVDTDGKMIGTISDGDIRRALLANISLELRVSDVMMPDFTFLKYGEDNFKAFDNIKKTLKKVVPFLDEESKIKDVISIRSKEALLPVDAILMAGGQGTRLRPLTENTPKPLLKVGDKPIIEHNIDRLALFGISKFNISLNYLGEQIETYLGNGKDKNIRIEYQRESKKLGTMGSSSLVPRFYNDVVLVMNSDILTNIDYADMYRHFLEKGSDMLVASVPYHVDIPYGVLEMKGGSIASLKEKPRYTYYSSAGIYMIRKRFLEELKKEQYWDATDMIEDLINRGRQVDSFAITSYWLDIGKPLDFEKAQEDIKHLDLN